MSFFSIGHAKFFRRYFVLYDYFITLFYNIIVQKMDPHAGPSFHESPNFSGPDVEMGGHQEEE